MSHVLLGGRGSCRVCSLKGRVSRPHFIILMHVAMLRLPATYLDASARLPIRHSCTAAAEAAYA